MDRELIKAYSSYWRKNRSSIETKELILLLKGIKKAARYVFPKIKPIEWKGISVFDDEKIVLDLSFILGEYPVPPEKVDALVGWVVHEAFHMKEMSSYVLYKAKDFSKSFSSPPKEIFLEMVEAGEDIYVNHCAKGSIWELYLERAWKWYYPRLRKDKENVLSILFDVWRMSFLENKFELPFGLSSLKDLYDILIELGTKIINVAKKKEKMEKAITRFNLYKDTWPRFYSLAKEWENGFVLNSDIFDIDPKAFNEREEAEKTLEATVLRRNLEELKESIASEEDITSQMKAVVHDSTNVMPTFFWEEETLCNVEPDLSVVKRLRSVFEAQKQKSKELRFINRALPFGKLDFRRLHKVFIDGRVFKEKEYKPMSQWYIVILVDASVSMSINKSKGDLDNWYNVQRTFASLFEAAKGYQNKVQLYAYYEQGGRCFISNLLKDNKLYTLSPRGRTPSGQAIMGIAMHMIKDKNRKRKLLVHITDGESNCGIDVADAIRYCERKGIQLITIGCGYKEDIKDYLKNTYKDIYFMKDFSELPNAIEHLFRKRIANG